MGKPIAEAEWDLDDVAGCFDYYAGLAEQLDGRQYEGVDLGSDDFRCALRREPLGVVALITPWNYPLLMSSWKVAPALAAGNTCVLKPSELASLTSLELAAIAQEVGLPAGVLNVITGTGADAGAPLSSHPGVAKVAFTGSVATGRRVYAAAAGNLRPATMELGGKSALIVFEDADIEKAVEWTMFGIFWTVGQICSATSRLLVHERIAPAFFAQLKKRAESIKMGNPLEPDCRLGPVVSAAQHDKIMGYIESGRAEGATLLTGGRRPPRLQTGFYVEPTVFINVEPHMRIWKEEIFGPVLAARTFASEAEAIQLANSTEFGLGAGVISADEARCRRVVEALECGLCWVNCSQPCFVQAPWGGVKNSGFGRELGTFGLESFLSVKQVTTYTSQAKWDWFPERSPSPRLTPTMSSPDRPDLIGTALKICWAGIGAYVAYSMGSGIANVGSGSAKLGAAAEAYQLAVAQAGDGIQRLAAAAEAYQPAVAQMGAGIERMGQAAERISQAAEAWMLANPDLAAPCETCRRALNGAGASGSS
ncbi:hypothetical protein COHA_009045 [Chlorella ohadii]|uniref:Aldehyde dehydrogenase domain-containing protein n=1 Tax=Chlorella ohadii TaxID=2649997 RepID=A0AAD5GY83_9CHLO|nr:hypothetical protein COHA_009045 [Chlorella ohadii]